MKSRVGILLVGFLVLVLGLGGTAYSWYLVIADGVYWRKASFLFPFFACLGLSMVLYPMTKAESLEKYGSEQLSWKHMPAGQKILILVGVLLGALQWAFFSGHIPF